MSDIIDPNMSIESLREENRKLKEELAALKSQDTADDKKQQPIQGMLKLLKTKNEQIQETIDKLEDTNQELQKSYEQTVRYYKRTITALSSAMEAKDPYFQFHSSNVQTTCRRMANAMNMDKNNVELLSTAAQLHDFGNIAVRTSVLHKEGQLTEEEFSHIKTHSMVASLLLEPIGDLGVVIEAVKHHHECYDGTGYPEGLSGEAIPLFARILFIAESYDALTTPRPYRTPVSQEAAVEDITGHMGTRYDPNLVNVFLDTIT